MMNKEEVQKISNRLEDRVRNFYETYNSVDSGMLRAHIIKDAQKYYELTGNFYRRTWNDGRNGNYKK